MNKEEHKAMLRRERAVTKEFPMFRKTVTTGGHLMYAHWHWAAGRSYPDGGTDYVVVFTDRGADGPARLAMGRQRGRRLGLDLQRVDYRTSAEDRLHKVFDSVRAAINYALISGWIA